MTNHDPYAEAIADLEAKMAEIKGTIDMLKRMRGLSVGNVKLDAHGGATAASATTPASEPIKADLIVTDTSGHIISVEAKSFEGPELAAIAVKQLETANCPMTARDIWAALARNGIQLTMRDPAYSIIMALKQRRAAEGDLVLTGYGKWALRKWFAANEIEELERKWGGTGGRDSKAHAEKTRAAIEKIIARGQGWGKRRTVTAEHMTKAYEAIQRGESKLAAATAAGIKHPTFAWYWKAFEMENWKPGLPFPPAKRAVELEKAPKKHEMWPAEKHANGHAKDNGPQLVLRPAEKL